MSFEESYRKAFPKSVEERFAKRRQLWLPFILDAKMGGLPVQNRLPI